MTRLWTTTSLASLTLCFAASQVEPTTEPFSRLNMALLLRVSELRQASVVLVEGSPKEKAAVREAAFNLMNGLDKPAIIVDPRGLSRAHPPDCNPLRRRLDQRRPLVLAGLMEDSSEEDVVQYLSALAGTMCHEEDAMETGLYNPENFLLTFTGLANATFSDHDMQDHEYSLVARSIGLPHSKGGGRGLLLSRYIYPKLNYAPQRTLTERDIGELSRLSDLVPSLPLGGFGFVSPVTQYTYFFRADPVVDSNNNTYFVNKRLVNLISTFVEKKNNILAAGIQS